MPKYVIIGNSAGGIGAVEAIREVDRAGSVAIISDEPVLAYSRPGIAEIVAGKKTRATITYRGETFYQKLGVETYFGRPVSRIDTAAKTVTLDRDEVVAYDQLLIATGGTPIHPPMKGSDKAGIYTFTTIADAEVVDQRVRGTGGHIVVIGAGLIGAACADALTRAGHHPTVVELRDRPLNLLLDETGSELVRRAMVKAGVDLVCNATVTEVVGRPDDEGVVGGVVLSTGRRIQCDTLIVAVGVRPRMDLATGAGIKTNRGIVVDQRMATSAPDVYACGDVAEAYDSIYAGFRVVPIWPGAYRGGRVAGLNMVGRSAKFDDQTTMNTIKYFGMSLVSAGDINPAADSGCEILSVVDLEHGRYRKFVLRDDAIVGFEIAGAIERSGVPNWLLKEGINVASFKRRLLDDNFDVVHVPAELRRAHYAEATANPTQTALAWGTRVSSARTAGANGGTNGSH